LSQGYVLPGQHNHQEIDNCSPEEIHHNQKDEEDLYTAHGHHLNLVL